MDKSDWNYKSFTSYSKFALTFLSKSINGIELSLYIS